MKQPAQPDEPETPERTRKRRRIMRAFDTNPMICQPCNIRFSDYHQTLIARERAETWVHLPADWKEGLERPTWEPLICLHPDNCSLQARMNELFEDPPKPLRFPGKRARQARQRKKAAP